MFFSKYVYKNYLNVLIELWPNPGLVCETRPMCLVLMANPIISWLFFIFISIGSGTV